MIESYCHRVRVKTDREDQIFSDPEFTELQGTYLASCMYSRGGIMRAVMRQIQEYLRGSKYIKLESEYDLNTIRFNLMLWFSELEDRYPGWVNPIDSFSLSGAIRPLDISISAGEFRSWFPHVGPQLRMTIAHQQKLNRYVLYVFDEQGIRGDAIPFHDLYDSSLQILQIIQMVEQRKGADIAEYRLGEMSRDRGYDEKEVVSTSVQGFHPYQRRIKYYSLEM